MSFGHQGQMIAVQQRAWQSRGEREAEINTHHDGAGIDLVNEVNDLSINIPMSPMHFRNVLTER